MRKKNLLPLFGIIIIQVIVTHVWLGGTLETNLCHSKISWHIGCHLLDHIVRDGTLSHWVDLLMFLFCRFLFQRASKLHYWFKNKGVFAWICQADNRVYSAHRHCRNLNLILESPKISTRWLQTPDKSKGPLCCKCHKQEELKKTLKY